MSQPSPGRSCPLDYRYGPRAIATLPVFAAETLYVAGGLYGNLAALDEIERMAAVEDQRVTILFNGDFNWFNVADDGYTEVNDRVLAHRAIAGNVEVELGRSDSRAGCGCGYPDSVDHATVDRSNEIHARLRATASRHPALTARLARLPRQARCQIGDTRVGIVHGDADSLAGWRFGIDALDAADSAATLPAYFRDAEVDVFACSHTCLPAMREVALAQRSGLIANNGAAGMPNFRGERYGVITRISERASPHAPLYSARIGATRVEALAVRYDAQKFARVFLADWPPGSPAHASYWSRIDAGTALPLAAAMPRPAGCATVGVACQVAAG
jgi:hypothetical protein